MSSGTRLNAPATPGRRSGHESRSKSSALGTAMPPAPYPAVTPKEDWSWRRPAAFASPRSTCPQDHLEHTAKHRKTSGCMPSGIGPRRYSAPGYQPFSVGISISRIPRTIFFTPNPTRTPPASSPMSVSGSVNCSKLGGMTLSDSKPVYDQDHTRGGAIADARENSIVAGESTTCSEIPPAQRSPDQHTSIEKPGPPYLTMPRSRSTSTPEFSPAGQQPEPKFASTRFRSERFTSPSPFTSPSGPAVPKLASTRFRSARLTSPSPFASPGHPETTS